MPSPEGQQGLGFLPSPDQSGRDRPERRAISLQFCLRKTSRSGIWAPPRQGAGLRGPGGGRSKEGHLRNAGVAVGPHPHVPAGRREARAGGKEHGLDMRSDSDQGSEGIDNRGQYWAALGQVRDARWKTGHPLTSEFQIQNRYILM